MCSNSESAGDNPCSMMQLWQTNPSNCWLIPPQDGCHCQSLTETQYAAYYYARYCTKYLWICLPYTSDDCGLPERRLDRRSVTKSEWKCLVKEYCNCSQSGSLESLEKCHSSKQVSPCPSHVLTQAQGWSATRGWSTRASPHPRAYAKIYNRQTWLNCGSIVPTQCKQCSSNEILNFKVLVTSCE